MPVLFEFIPQFLAGLELYIAVPADEFVLPNRTSILVGKKVRFETVIFPLLSVTAVPDAAFFPVLICPIFVDSCANVSLPDAGTPLPVIAEAIVVFPLLTFVKSSFTAATTLLLSVVFSDVSVPTNVPARS
ncbi:hypothetical protein D3C72_1302970 [compost metagenome]